MTSDTEETTAGRGGSGPTVDLNRRIRAEEQAYSPDESRPLRGYAALMATYGGAVTAIAVATRIARRGAPVGFGPWDVTLLSVATHRLSRTLTKDAVTSPLRAPFTRYQGTGAPSELTEEVRGHGVRHAIGELITCPFCVAQWVATGLTASYLLAPRATRAAAATLTAVAAADFLQFAYARAQQLEG